MSSGLNIVVLASGRGTNFQALIDACQNKKLKSRLTCLIVNKKDAPALQRAQKANIPTRLIPSQGCSQQDFENGLLAELAQHKPDLIVLAGFMKILSASFVAAYAQRIINIHPSLLPAFPGLNAQKQALEAGVKVTGCTVHFVDEGCDTGPIIVQKTEPIYTGDTEDSLSQRLLIQEHKALTEAVELIENDKVVLQDHKTLISQ